MPTPATHRTPAIVAAGPDLAPEPSSFPSFFMACLKCSMPCLPDMRRLDELAPSQPDRQFAADYRRLREAGLLTVREAAPWPLIERSGRPGQPISSFSSAYFQGPEPANAVLATTDSAGPSSGELLPDGPPGSTAAKVYRQATPG